MTAVPPRRVPSTPFGDDDGSADPRIVAALAAYERGEGGSADVLAALAAGRLLIPVVAVAESVDATGMEKETAMATVLTTGRDGRRGLLAFTCVESLQRWNPAARPSPVPTRSAVEAALADGAEALVIDLAGPIMFAVDAPDLRSLASGWRPLGTWPGVEQAEPTVKAAAAAASARSVAGAGVRRTGGRVWRRVRRRVRRAFSG
ncbi:SseB family protein [Jiangella alkaliphila]|uniref:SseB protein N-terminal domain-containing protein n=1 Tax=Jiangella alkaliphila TaxID=419479 RepID=A0A1H2KD39_9ACTN|nr:SseB family protein [Jiangella alkaliphila]SDU66266.1 SseB protein N-terminal domain-containing protein [Jiangella alkaliphila]